MIQVKEYYREDGKIDMCTALKELIEESEKRGERRGEIIGERRGEKRGQKRGEKNAEERLIGNLMESMHLTREQAETALKINRNRKHRTTQRNSRVQKRKN